MAEMAAQVEVIIERAIDASWVESREFLLDKT